jgi:hypothetical protein
MSILPGIAASVEKQRQDADQAAGLARLQQYADEQGLRDSQENANAVGAWLAENGKTISPANIDAAVAALAPNLQWNPPAPPPEPTEVLEDWQLPIDADEYLMKRAPVKALQDLIARRRKATNQQYIRRGFGSAF